MRHQRAGVHLSRTSAHRKALFANLVAALFTHDRIRTTGVKAHATRRIAERTITWARRLGDVLTKTPEKRSVEESARVVHAVRLARRVVRDRHAVSRLFEEIAPRYLGRPGGYTRIVKMGPRVGDAAEMALLELIPGEGGSATTAGGPKAKASTKAAEPVPTKSDKGKKASAPKGGKAEKVETKAKGRAKAEAGGKPAAKKPRAKKSDE